MADRKTQLRGWPSGVRTLIVLLECCAAACVIACLAYSSSSDADCTLALLPLCYLLFLLVLGMDNFVCWAPGIVVLNIVLFLRFVFVPLAMCVTGDVSVYVLRRQNIAYSVPLMLYELLAIGLVLHLTAKRTRIVVGNGSERTLRELHYGSLIAMAAIVGMLVIAYRNPYFVSGFSLITEGSVEGYSESDTASGTVVALWHALLAWVYVWAFLAIRKRSEGASTLSLSVAATYAFLLLVYIGQISISRWHVVIAFAASLCCLAALYPQHRKGVLLWTTVPVVLLVLTASAFKNSTFLWAGIDYGQALREIFDISIYDIYLAGPGVMSDAVTIYQAGVADISSLLVDVAQSLPFVNHWVDNSMSTIYQFKLMWGRGDLIMPLVGQSMVYFSWPFAPALSAVSVWLLRIFDRRCVSAKGLPELFIDAFSAAWLGIATVLNVTITVSWFGLYILPFWLLVFTANVFGSRKGEARRSPMPMNSQQALGNKR